MPDLFNQQEIEQKIKAFVAKESKLIGQAEITDEMKLFSGGILDSLAFVKLALFLEDEFNFRPKTGLSMHSVDSVSGICRLILGNPK